MSTAAVDNKGLEAPSPFKTFMKNNMQLLLVTLALLVVLAFFSFAVPNFAFVTREVYLGIGTVFATIQKLAPASITAAPDIEAASLSSPLTPMDKYYYKKNTAIHQTKRSGSFLAARSS